MVLVVLLVVLLAVTLVTRMVVLEALVVVCHTCGENCRACTGCGRLNCNDCYGKFCHV